MKEYIIIFIIILVLNYLKKLIFKSKKKMEYFYDNKNENKIIRGNSIINSNENILNYCKVYEKEFNKNYSIRCLKEIKKNYKNILKILNILINYKKYITYQKSFKNVNIDLKFIEPSISDELSNLINIDFYKTIKLMKAKRKNIHSYINNINKNIKKLRKFKNNKNKFFKDKNYGTRGVVVKKKYKIDVYTTNIYGYELSTIKLNIYEATFIEGGKKTYFIHQKDRGTNSSFNYKGNIIKVLVHKKSNYFLSSDLRIIHIPYVLAYGEFIGDPRANTAERLNQRKKNKKKIINYIIDPLKIHKLLI